MDNIQLELWKNLNEENSLIQVQEYIKKVIELREFSEQNIEKNYVTFNRRSWRTSKSDKKR